MQHDTHERAQAAFYPYGSARDEGPPAAAAARHHPGTAEVQDAAGRIGLETYVLERTGEHWLLKSRLFDAPERLLARVSGKRLPAGPLDTAAELLVDLWTLRQPGRLRFIRGLHAGELGPLRWRRVLARIPLQTPLEHRLRAEGHTVLTGPGPIGTTEHILPLRRA